MKDTLTTALSELRQWAERTGAESRRARREGRNGELAVVGRVASVPMMLVTRARGEMDRE